MKKRKQHIRNAEGQEHEDVEGEENEESCSCSTALIHDEGDKCPICLNCLLEQEIGFPENCSHTFCMTCILKWAETKASCPIDRRPFQAIRKLDALDQIKVQVKKQLREMEEEEICVRNKGKYSHAKMRSFMRRAVRPERGPLAAKLNKVVKKKYSEGLCDKRNKKAISVKINKPRRETCWREGFRTNFYSTVPADRSIDESFFSCRNDCPEFTEINTVIRQKRRELELSCPSVLARVERIPLMSYGAEAETFLLTPTTVPGTILPRNIRPLENIESLGKGYAVACTQEGEEKKQASGSSGTRGARKKSVNTTPRRRSARNSKNETLSQSRSSPRSSSSGCSAPDGNNTSLNKSSSESEKALPKRKSKRVVKQQTPLVKKKLRSSARSEKSSSDSVEGDEVAESEAVLMLDKDHQSDNESNNPSLLHRNNMETESANGLESCSEHAEIEETAGKCDKDEDTSGSADTSLSVQVQEPPIRTLEGESLEFEIKDVTEKNVDIKNQDICEDSLEQVEAMTIPRDGELIERMTTMEKDQTLCSPQNELLANAETLAKIDQPIVSPKNEWVEYPESLEKGSLMGSLRSKLHEPPEAIEIDDSEAAERTVVDCVSTDIPNLKSVEDNEADMLIKNINSGSASEQSLKEKALPESEEGRTSESPQINSEHKHFGEDNNEMIPMDCDSFCSDQNEPHIEQLPLVDSMHQGEVSSLQNDAGNCTSLSGLSDEKDETIPQREHQLEFKKDKKTRTRRSRFHSPSTTWSPSGREGRKSQSPSPKREVTKDRSSRSPKKETVREGKRSSSQSPKRETLRDEKKTPSRSPKKETISESRRSSSQSRAKDSSPRQKSRSRSSDRDSQRRDRDRERRNRRWSRSQSRSRSRSRSRTRNKGSSFSRSERDGHSPRWKERWANDSWRSPRGNDRYTKSDQEKQNENLKEKDNTEKHNDDQCSSDKRRNDCPDWVMERINSVPEIRNRERDKPHWEDYRHDNSGYSWNKNFTSGWISHRGRGRGRGGRGRGGFMYGDQGENHWQNRKPLSGNSNGSGNETSRFPEHQPYRRKNEQDYSFDTPADRSGWTSASSWAVRKTLPADVQNYYSRRGRNSSSPQSGWGMRQEEETPEQDPNLKDQANQQSDGSQIPMNMMQQQMNVMPQVNAQHQPMNIFPYPVGVHPPMMNMQRSPFNIHPPMPLHLHTGVPLIQVAAPTNLSQGLPPPPPPPPPSQQVNYVASQQDGKQLQGIPSAPHVSNNMSAPALSAPTAALGNVGTVQGPSSGNATSSSHIKSSNAAVKVGENKASVTVEASADSSKKDQKLLIQEKAAQEVKLAIKPFYQNKDITKEEYKEIVRKAVDKVCHSKSGEVNSAKVANLVKAYVDKYKHSRKKNPEEAVSCERK